MVKRKGPKIRFYKFLIICFGMFGSHTRETNIAWFFWETFKLSILQSWCPFDVHDFFGIGKSRHANVFQANLTVTLVDLFGIGWTATKCLRLDTILTHMGCSQSKWQIYFLAQPYNLLNLIHNLLFTCIRIVLHICANTALTPTHALASLQKQKWTLNTWDD